MFACLLFLVFGEARAKSTSAEETERTEGNVVGPSISHPAKWFVEREPYTFEETYGFPLWKPESGLPHDHGGTPAVRVALAYDFGPGKSRRWSGTSSPPTQFCRFAAVERREPLAAPASSC